MNSKYQTNPYTTILTDAPSSQSPSADHPLFYYEQRNNFLSNLSDQYSIKYKLPTMDLRRNVRVHYYMDKYSQVKQQVQSKQTKQKCYLNSEQFQSVFGQCIDQRRRKNREKKQQENLRNQLRKYLEMQNMSVQQPQHDHSNTNIDGKQEKQEQNKYNTVLVEYRDDPAKQKQMYLLDLEIGKLKLQQQIQKRIPSKNQTCHNQLLVSRLSNNILSAYMVNFEQIFKQLMDQILTEQVYYLNYIEANYKIQKSQWQYQHENPRAHKREDEAKFENIKTIKMMELIKGLDELCDD